MFLSEQDRAGGMERTAEGKIDRIWVMRKASPIFLDLSVKGKVLALRAS